MILLLPILTLFFFLLCGANMAAPPTLNLMSEIFLIGRILKYRKLMLLIFPLGSYIGAVFTLFLFSYSQHGKAYEGGQAVYTINLREFHLIGFHLLPLNLLVLRAEFLGLSG